MKSLLLSVTLLLMISASPVAHAEPNDLTSQYCSGMKTMARQVKEGRDLGMTQADYSGLVADNERKFAGTPNVELVVQMSRAIVKAAWLSSDDPQTFSELVHETCLETVVLEP